MRDARQRQRAQRMTLRTRADVRPCDRSTQCRTMPTRLDHSTAPTDSSGVYSTAAKTKNQEPLRTRARRLGGPCARLRRSEYYTYTCSDYQNPQVTLRLPDAQKAQKAPRCSVKLCLPRGGNRSSLRPANREGGCCCCCSLQPAGRAAQVNWLSLYEQSSRELRVGCRREAPAWQHILGMDDAMGNDAARQGEKGRKEGRRIEGRRRQLAIAPSLLRTNRVVHTWSRATRLWLLARTTPQAADLRHGREVMEQWSDARMALAQCAHASTNRGRDQVRRAEA